MARALEQKAAMKRAAEQKKKEKAASMKAKKEADAALEAKAVEEEEAKRVEKRAKGLAGYGQPFAA